MSQLESRLKSLLGPAFELERELSGAGMSRVFVAREVPLDRRVVVKVLPPDLVTDAGLARFRREVQVTARLQHPHILPVISTGADGDLVYYVAPYVESESLRRHLAAGRRFTLDDALALILELLGAVSHAHARGIIHRDIKPGNVLLSGRHAILADFGIARALGDPDDGAHRTGSSIVPSPAYFAPERPRDEHADLWAIAVLTHELVTGELPSFPVTADSLAAAWTRADATLDPARARIAARAIARALDVEQSRRFPSATAFAEALREVVRATGSMPAVSRDARSRRRRAVYAALAVGVTSLIAIGIAAVTRSDVDAADASAPRLVRVATLESGADSASRVAAEQVSQLVASALSRVNGLHVVRDGVLRGSNAWKELSGTLTSGGGMLQAEVEVRGSSDSVSRVVVAGSADSVAALADRIAVELLPRFYPPLPQRPSVAVLHGTAKPEALRLYIEGELALARGATEAAFTAFREATEADPRFTYAWYRRAVAAERSIRVLDADSSIAIAKSQAQSLPMRERLLVEGFAAFREGDARRADSTYQQVMQGGWRDAEAWTQLGELGYHSGPLLGRPIESARDAWDQVLRADSSDPAALMHALRLAARRGDLAAVRALDRRLGADSAADVPVVESHVIAAYTLGDARAMDAANRALDTLPDNSVYFLHSMIAGMLQRPDLAVPIARRLVVPARPVAVRAQGYISLAHLAFARGRPREAWRHLDSAAALDPQVASIARASLATMPFVNLPREMVAGAARALAEAPKVSTSTPLYLELVADVPALPVIRPYLAVLLAMRQGRRASPLSCGTTNGSVRDLCRDLQLGLEAERTFAEAPGDALPLLDRMNMIVPYQLAGRSVFFARTRERYRRAEALESRGALHEAELAYAAAIQPSRLDYTYLAPTHLRLARLADRAGRRAEAAAHYRFVVALLRDAEPEFIPMRDEAQRDLEGRGR